MRQRVLLLPALGLLFGSLALADLRTELVQATTTVKVEAPVLQAGPCERFARLEFHCPLIAGYMNPFDPDDIQVDGLLRLPDGQQVVVPAFYYQGWEPENDRTQMMLSVRYRRLPHEDGWRLRFAPSEVGEHRLQIVVRQHGRRTDLSPETTFQVADSARPGFIEVAPGNRTQFADSGTGRLFAGFGANVAWTRAKDPGDPLPCYEYYFGKAKGKMNATRVWLCHWAWLEWTRAVDAPGTNWDGYAGIGYYNPMIAVALDRVFRLADENGLRVMLVTEDNNEHWGSDRADEWAANPYNRKNGGPCASPGEVFTSPEARDWYRKRLRYIVARWGAETALWAIDSWNDCSDPQPAQLAWLREMRDEVHALTRGWRPLIYGSNYARAANTEMDYAQASNDPRNDRPNVTQECHYSEQTDWFVPVLREQLWQGLALGRAVTMVWPHVLVDKTNAWDTFRAPMEFAQTLPLLTGTWQSLPVTVGHAQAEGEPPYRSIIELSAYGDVPSWGQPATANRFEVRAEGGNQWLVGFCPNLYGKNRAAWRNPPTFVCTLPAPGALIADIDEIGGGTQVLSATVDGETTVTVSLPDGRRYPRPEERWARIPLPAGSHTVLLDNAGDDWLRLRKLYLAWDNPSADRLVQATGRTNGTVGFAYVRNLTHSRVAREVLRQQPLELYDVALSLAGLPEGSRYAVRLVDPGSGATIREFTATAGPDGLAIPLNRLATDLVLRFERQP